MIVVVHKLVCCGIKQGSLGSVDGVASNVLADSCLRLIYELGGICEKVRDTLATGEYIQRTSAHMDGELSRRGLDSCVSFVFVLCT